MRGAFSFGLGFLVSVSLACNALAWDKHEALMPWVLRALPSEASAELERPIQAPCLADDVRMYARLRKELELNPDLSFEQMHLKPTAENCTRPTTALAILSRGFVDDPDQGMDRDLPDSADPENDRAWMGGKSGPTSQGFRHMYFGGWKLAHPIETFQIPMHAIGQAPGRAQLLADEANRLFEEGKVAWGWRIVSWELHYLQDLAQPFHAVQVLTPRMLPLSALFAHFGDFGAFLRESTRTVANYHWAYEGLVLHELELGQRSPLDECLKEFVEHSNLNVPANLTVKAQALAVARSSVEIGNPLGRAMIATFGTGLKDPGVDLAHGQGTPDYLTLAKLTSKPMTELNGVSCQALSNAIRISRIAILNGLTPPHRQSAAPRAPSS